MMTELLLIFFLFQIHQNERIHIIVFSSHNQLRRYGEESLLQIGGADLQKLRARDRVYGCSEATWMSLVPSRNEV